MYYSLHVFYRVIANGLLMGFTYVCMFFKSNRKRHCRKETLLHDLVMYYMYLWYEGKQHQSRKSPIVIHLVWKEKQHHCENSLFSFVFSFDLLAVMYECFALHVFLFCVPPSVCSEAFLSHSVMFRFLWLPIKLP